MATNEPQRREESPSLTERLGRKKLAVTVAAIVIVVPIALITLGVVAIPVLAIPAALVFGVGILIYALARSKDERLPDEEH